MAKSNRLIHGVGVNDSNYAVKPMVEGKQAACKIYTTWQSMLQRCYSEKSHIKQPEYIGCTVCDEWKSFSNFKAWMETQDWEGKQLDKDLLVKGNKIYSPDTCVFVSKRINVFLTESDKIRGEYPIGVDYVKKKKGMVNELTKPYRAKIKNGSGKQISIGYFSTPEEAHAAWIAAKLALAKELAVEILTEGGDLRVAKALLDRYENYISVN